MTFSTSPSSRTRLSSLFWTREQEKSRVLKVRLGSKPSLGMEERYNIFGGMEEIKSEAQGMTRYGEKGIESGVGVHILAIKVMTTGLYKEIDALRTSRWWMMSLDRLSNRGTTINSVHPLPHSLFYLGLLL